MEKTLALGLIVLEGIKHKEMSVEGDIRGRGRFVNKKDGRYFEIALCPN